jgi:hypothetical protein
MSNHDDEIGTYSFFPWLRQGIANKVTTPDDPEAKRGEITVSLEIEGKAVDDGPAVFRTVDKVISLYGPGDIVGIDRKAIVKTEPRNWITNFEPNYCPYFDCSDPDFLWRYTPSAPDGDRLLPWLTLVVLQEDEFTDGNNILNRPLHYFTLKDEVAADVVFPPKDDLWAWAHVHINKDIVGNTDNPISTDQNAFINQFKSVLNQDPDLAYSRLLSPRKLDENLAYHAFVIPTFEAGRLAGLGFDPLTISGYGANTISWEEYGAGRQETKNFPYYYRWFFRTSSVGDFEYLVRLLEPKVADSRVGHRDIDVLDPGSNLNGITDEALQGILRLGGALQVPKACLDEQQTQEYNKYDNWFGTYPHQFQSELAAFINLADDYNYKTTAKAHEEAELDIEDEDDDPDPLITSPLYARWHAMVSRVLTQDDGAPVANNENWVHQLNLDPRWRTAANLGTDVIQENQENYMDAAWEQVGDVLEANRRFRWGQLAGFASKVWYKKNVSPKPGVALDKYLWRTAPIHKRILTRNFVSNNESEADKKRVTVFHGMKSSLVSHALVSAPMRRIVRPRGRLMRTLQFDATARNDNLVTRVNTAEVNPAPPHEVPEGLLTHADITEVTRPSYVPDFIADLLSRYPWIQYLPLILAVIIILLLFITGVAAGSLISAIGAVAAAGVLAFLALHKMVKDIQDADVILPDNQTPEAVDQLPNLPDFRVTEFGDTFVPTVGAVDSPEATRFKTALRANFDFVQRSAEAGRLPRYTTMNIPSLVNDVVAGVNPEMTIPRYLFGHIEIPAHILEALNEKFVEAMAYPVIDLPMYEPLLATGTDNFVPNLNLIEQNSITLLETNQRFIESYMVGINHEFVREEQWRGFPTDLRGTCFRQFWDVTSFMSADDLNDEEKREKFRDIPPLHRWSLRKDLGSFDLREEAGDKEEEVVLVIRGELLKKYPTAVIYAHRAKWSLDDEDNIDLTKPRDFETEGDESDFIKTPLYQAKAEPDIYFFGFDLTIPEAKGGSGEGDDTEPGWFFVIKERPGEPRFGLDVPGEAADFTVAKVDTWNELSWSHAVENVSPGMFISLSGPRTINVDSPVPPQPDEDEGETHDAWQQMHEDSHLTWNNSINSAELAYILYQVPVLIGVHAAEMLPDECNNEV